MRAGIYGSVAAAVGGFVWYRGTDGQILSSGRSSESAGALPAYQFARADKRFLVAERGHTDQAAVARHVNYYEFSPRKVGTWRLAAALPVRPWEVTVAGLVHQPMTFAIDDLDRRFGLEERVYRHRCVETWAMVVPWIGFPFRKLMEVVRPSEKQMHVRFVTADVEAAHAD